jgi:hypothetical protein
MFYQAINHKSYLTLLFLLIYYCNINKGHMIYYFLVFDRHFIHIRLRLFSKKISCFPQRTINDERFLN